MRTLAAVAVGQAPGPESSILKVRGTEIQQRLDELYVWTPRATTPCPSSQNSTNSGTILKQHVMGEGSRDTVMLYGISTTGKRRSTAVRMKFRRTLSPSTCSDCIVSHLYEVSMDFSVTEEQSMLADTVSRFIDNDYSHSSGAWKSPRATRRYNHRRSGRAFAELGLLTAVLVRRGRWRPRRWAGGTDVDHGAVRPWAGTSNRSWPTSYWPAAC